MALHEYDPCHFTNPLNHHDSALVSELGRSAASLPKASQHGRTRYGLRAQRDCCTSHRLASSAGLNVLQQGGNAVDAAVTAAAVLSVTEPMMTGIGGDVFAIVWLADEKRMVGLNSSGRSGSLMTREILIERGHQSVPSTGPESVTVPGALSGWAELLKNHGTISLGAALQPAIAIARNGFPISPRIARLWKERERDLMNDKGTWKRRPRSEAVKRAVEK